MFTKCIKQNVEILINKIHNGKIHFLILCRNLFILLSFLLTFCYSSMGKKLDCEAWWLGSKTPESCEIKASLILIVIIDNVKKLFFSNMIKEPKKL